MGPKDLVTPSHLISSPRPTLRKKKHLRTNKEGPSCWETSPRTTLSLANQGHGRRKRHTLKDSPPRRPKQNDQHSGPAMRAWWRSNSRRWPIIPPQQINVSSCQSGFFPKRSLGGEELGGIRRCTRATPLELCHG